MADDCEALIQAFADAGKGCHWIFPEDQGKLVRIISGIIAGQAVYLKDLPLPTRSRTAAGTLDSPTHSEEQQGTAEDRKLRLVEIIWRFGNKEVTRIHVARRVDFACNRVDLLDTVLLGRHWICTSITMRIGPWIGQEVVFHTLIQEMFQRTTTPEKEPCHCELQKWLCKRAPLSNLDSNGPGRIREVLGGPGIAKNKRHHQ